MRKPWLLAVLLSIVAHAWFLWSMDHRKPQRLGGPRPSTLNIYLQARPQAQTDGPKTEPKEAKQLAENTKKPSPDLPSPLGPSAPPYELPPTLEAVSGPLYYPADQLTVKPLFLRDDGAPTPKFLPDVMPLPVMVTVFINEDGTVDEVALAESFLSNEAKDFIVHSFKAMQFSPGKLGEVSVKSQLSFEVNLNPALPVP